MVISRICKCSSDNLEAVEGDLILCDSVTASFFEIPEDVDTVTIKLSTKKTKESYEIKQTGGKNCYLHYEGSWNFVLLLLSAERLLEKAFRLSYEKTLYVSIEY